MGAALLDGPAVDVAGPVVVVGALVEFVLGVVVVSAVAAAVGTLAGTAALVAALADVEAAAAAAGVVVGAVAETAGPPQAATKRLAAATVVMRNR